MFECMGVMGVVFEVFEVFKLLCILVWILVWLFCWIGIKGDLNMLLVVCVLMVLGLVYIKFG